MFLLTDSKSGNRSHSNCCIQMAHFVKHSTNKLELIKRYKQNPVFTFGKEIFFGWHRKATWFSMTFF